MTLSPFFTDHQRLHTDLRSPRRSAAAASAAAAAAINGHDPAAAVHHHDRQRPPSRSPTAARCSWAASSGSTRSGTSSASRSSPRPRCIDRLFRNVGIGRDTTSLMLMVTPADHHPRGGGGAAGHPDDRPLTAIRDRVDRRSSTTSRRDRPPGEPLPPAAFFAFCSESAVRISAGPSAGSVAASRPAPLARRPPEARSCHAGPSAASPWRPAARLDGPRLGRQPPRRRRRLPARPGLEAAGRSLWFDPEGSRLILRARVVLREGPLEHLLCLKGPRSTRRSSPPTPSPARSTPACS